MDNNDITITLSKGKVGLLSNEDSDLAAMRWSASARKDSPYYYACRQMMAANGDSALAYLHRVVLSRVLGRGLMRHEHVDHINGCGVDNRRNNLRLATNTQNSHNRGAHRKSTSGYKGVSFATKDRKWQAHIRIAGKNIYLGYFSNIVEAALTYDASAILFHGEFAQTNYPRFACGLGD